MCVRLMDPSFLYNKGPTLVLETVQFEPLCTIQLLQQCLPVTYSLRERQHTQGGNTRASHVSRYQVHVPQRDLSRDLD